MSDNGRPAWEGAMIMPLLVIALIAVTSIPLATAILVVSWLPGIGGLGPSGYAGLFHLFWIFPAMWVYSFPSEAFVKVYGRTKWSRRISEWTMDALFLLLLGLALQLILANRFGCLVAALLSITLFKVATVLVDRHEKDKGQDAEAA